MKAVEICPACGRRLSDETIRDRIDNGVRNFRSCHKCRPKIADDMRFKVAYLRINSGWSLKQIAYHLKIGLKNCEWHWAMAANAIRHQFQ